MRLIDDRLVCWATDLGNFLACPHLTAQTRAVEFGAPKPPKFEDPAAEVLRERGEQHEAEILSRFEADGLSVDRIEFVRFDDSQERWRDAAARTLEAMRSGADVIYQGTLYDGTWLGRPDFLRCVEEPSDLGGWSYEVIDAKLASHAKAGALTQIALYSDLLGVAQGTEPERMHLALGGADPKTESFRVADYAAYYRLVRRRFEAQLAIGPDARTCPEPVDHCDVCDWSPVCRKRWRDDDHISLVAGITRAQRDRLGERGVTTLAGLGALALPLDPPLEGVGETALEKVREQARIQLEGRERGENLFEFLAPIEPGKGLAALPAPSPGDLFFDIESDNFALGEGLEYLFGVADADGGYDGDWALTRSREKAIFEAFIDRVVGRLEAHPDLHVYHYAAYEPSALKRLAHRHATRSGELDRLLRGEVFVDLYRVVRQGLRASVESYSIKKLEPFYGFEREEDLRDASSALRHFEAWLQLGGGPELDSDLERRIEGYNRDDVVSTLRLRNWLEGLRGQLIDSGTDVPRPLPKDDKPGEDLADELTEVAELQGQLTDALSEDEAEWSDDERARWILAHLLEWHRREDKSFWWEYFTWRDMTDEELIDDRKTLGGLTYEGVVDRVKRSLVHRYRYPPQDHDIGENAKPDDPVTGARAGTVVAVDEHGRTIDLKRAAASDRPHPTALIPRDLVDTDDQRESLKRLARDLIRDGLHGDGPRQAACDLLLRRYPRVGREPGEPLVDDDGDLLEAAKRLGLALDGTVLPIQGPPGSGKTYTGARMILSLMQAGKTVGVTATSHKVINNLLRAVCEAAQRAGSTFAGLQKASDGQWCGEPEIERAENYDVVTSALAAGTVRLVAGTAWLWAREDMTGAVDVLVVDEAGQVSLANVLAVSQAARDMVLLGDPRQLEQPQKGVHPPGCDVSALEHLFGTEITVPPERGLFLERTWRLHPDICAFTSEQFYLGRLRSQDDMARQRVDGPDPFDGTGLRFVPVEHAGNRNESREEVERVAELVGMLVGSGATWTNHRGAVAPIGLADVLVVAPYNAQVSALIARLPDGARVGTVDKFQGQEAPIVICSLATSTAAEAPRGMEFLFAMSRLNVATSRARCLAVIVGNPELFAPECRSVRQMELANGFCRFVEMAG